jgi:simple sugar transport system permease protein
VAILVGGIAASGSLLQLRLGLPDASVMVLLGFAFVALIGCETLRGRKR